MSDLAWRCSQPPNEEFVEVECDGKIIGAMAVYGRDGMRPHWRSGDGTSWDHNRFVKWRPTRGDVEPQTGG